MATTWEDSIVTFENSTVQWVNVYVSIPSEMVAAIVDPRSGGAWLWLIEVHLTGYDAVYLARNTEDVIYGGSFYTKWNVKLGQQRLTSDGTIPRTSIYIAKDGNYTLEDKLNAAEGATGTVKVIKTNENFFDTIVDDLETTYNILGASSDSQWLTFILGVPNPLYRKIPLRCDSSKVCPYFTPSLFKGVECQYDGVDTTCTGLYGDCYTKGNLVHWGGEVGLDPNAMRL